MKPIVTVEEFPESPDKNVIYVKLSTREILFYTPLGFSNFEASLPAPQDLFVDTSVTFVDAPDSENGSGYTPIQPETPDFPDAEQGPENGDGDGVSDGPEIPTDGDAVVSCASSPVTITVSSEYDSETGTSTFKYTTSDSNGNGGLFGCINAVRGQTLTINVVGSEADLESHPLKITDYNDLGQAKAPLSGVQKTEYGAEYTLTWTVPCDETVTKYQYQCENHAGMRGTINVTGTCPDSNDEDSGDDSDDIDYVLPKSNHETNYYSTTDISYGDFICVSSPDLPMAGVFSKIQDETYNNVHYYERSLGNSSNEKMFFFWTGTEWALALSKTSDTNDFLAHGGSGATPTNPARVDPLDWTTDLTNFSVNLVSQYKVDTPSDYTDSDTEWFGYYVYDQEGALWHDGSNTQFRTTPHASIFAYKQIAYLDKTPVRTDSQHFIIGEYNVINGCLASYKDLRSKGINVQVAEEGSNDPRISTTTDAEIILSYPEGSIDSNQDIDLNTEGIQVSLNSNEVLGSSTSFPENTTILVPFCDAAIDYSLNIYKISESNYVELQDISPDVLKSKPKLFLSNDVDEKLDDVPFVSENVCLNNGFLNLNFLNSNFAVDETVAELTLDTFTQGLFSSSNNDHALAVQNLEGKYNIDSPVGPEFDQPMSSSEWINNSNNNFSFSNNLISTDTYAWELSAQITLPPAQGSYYGRTMNITLQKTESLSVENDLLQEHLENYTPIGSYKIKSLTIN